MNKKDKLEAEDYSKVHLFYKEYIGQGTPITQIAKLYNEINQSNYAESTLRNRYELIEQGYIARLDADHILKREREADRKLIQSDIKLREANNHIKYTKSLAREVGDRTTVANIIENSILKGYEPATGLVKFEDSKTNLSKCTAFVLSDAHAGYKFAGHYGVDTFQKRMNKAFQEIYDRTVEQGLDEIYIFELGDQIEGTALRKGQLAQVATLMAGQVNLYLDSYLSNLRRLVKALPEVKINLAVITRDNHSEIRVHGTQRNELDDSLASVIGARITSEVLSVQEFGGMSNVTIATGDDLLIELSNGIVVYLAHGHLNTKDTNKIHEQVIHSKGLNPEIAIVGHWHRHTATTRNVINGFQGKTITAPSIVGDTDYSHQLHLSGLPGILMLEVYDTHVDDKFIPLIVDITD